MLDLTQYVVNLPLMFIHLNPSLSLRGVKRQSNLNLLLWDCFTSFAMTRLIFPPPFNSLPPVEGKLLFRKYGFQIYSCGIASLRSQWHSHFLALDGRGLRWGWLLFQFPCLFSLFRGFSRLVSDVWSLMSIIFYLWIRGCFPFPLWPILFLEKYPYYM